MPSLDDPGPFWAGYDNEGRPWADRWPERHKTVAPKQATDPAVADDTKESVKRTKRCPRPSTHPKANTAPTPTWSSECAMNALAGSVLRARTTPLSSSRRFREAVERAERSMRNADPTDAFDLDQTATPAYRSAWLSLIRGTASDRSRGVLKYGEHRDLSLGTNSAGGYLVPKSFRDQLVTSQAQAGAIRGLATVIETDGNGSELDVPVTDASGAGAAATLLTENTAPVEQDPTFTQLALHAYPFVAPQILVPWTMIRDRDFLPSGVTPLSNTKGASDSVGPLDIMTAIADIGGLRLALGEEPFWAVGNGSGQPQGITVGTTTGVTTASNAAITWVEVVKLWQSVNAVYRANATWMMNSATAAFLMELEDSAGQPLFNAAWGPLKILGSPVVINNSFPSIGSATSPIVYGDIRRAYYIRTAGVVSVPIVERWADKLQSALLLFERCDGAVADPKAAMRMTMHV